MSSSNSHSHSELINDSEKLQLKELPSDDNYITDFYLNYSINLNRGVKNRITCIENPFLNYSSNFNEGAKDNISSENYQTGEGVKRKTTPNENQYFRETKRVFSDFSIKKILGLPEEESSTVGKFKVEQEDHLNQGIENSSESSLKTIIIEDSDENIPVEVKTLSVTSDGIIQTENLKNLRIFNLEEVESKQLYKYFLELASKLIYFRNNFDQFNRKFFKLNFPKINRNHTVKTILSASNPNFQEFPTTSSNGIKISDQLRIFVDTLLQLNTNNNNQINFEVEKNLIEYFRKRRIQYIKVLESRKKEQEDYEDIQTTYIQQQLENLDREKEKILQEASFVTVLEQIKFLIGDFRNFFDIGVAWVSVFESVNKIVTFYNQRLRHSLHSHLKNLDLSFKNKNQVFINYSEFVDHPNYLAYLLVDIFLGLFSENQNGSVGYFLDQLKEKGLIPNLSILALISLNDPDVSLNLLNNKNSIEELVTFIRTIFSGCKDNMKFELPYNNILSDIESFNNIEVNIFKNKKLTQIEGLLHLYLLKLYKVSYFTLITILNKRGK